VEDNHVSRFEEQELPLAPAPGEVGRRAGLKRESQRSGGRSKTKKPRQEARKSSSPVSGDIFEMRVARVEFAEGGFVRLRVPVRVDAESGKGVLTDVDVLSIDVDLRLRIARSGIECKSAPGQSGEPDRLFWLRGFQDYLHLDRAVLARQTASRRGLKLARALGLHVLDAATLENREAANAWLPQTFAHVGGSACAKAETRADTQLRAISEVSADLVAFLRHDALFAPSYRLLSALTALGAQAGTTKVFPEMLALVLSGHALLVLLIAAIQDAGAGETVSNRELRSRLELALVTGAPDDAHVLEVLGQADQLVAAQIEEIHRAYAAAGAKRPPVDALSLRSLVGEPPQWIDRYVDLVERLRAVPSVARDLLQTSELAIFEGLLGGEAWKAAAFNHLFTPEHRNLLSAAIPLLNDIIGSQLAAQLSPVLSLEFNRSGPAVPDRREGQTQTQLPPKLAQEEGRS
jgi:hypothetical protein